MESEGGHRHFVLVEVEAGEAGGAVLGHLHTDQPAQTGVSADIVKYVKCLDLARETA